MVLPLISQVCECVCMCDCLFMCVCVSVEPRLLFTMSLKGNKSNKIARHWSEQSCKTCFCFVVVVVVTALKMRSLFLLPVVILLSFFNSKISSIYYTIS